MTKRKAALSLVAIFALTAWLAACAPNTSTGTEATPEPAAPTAQQSESKEPAPATGGETSEAEMEGNLYLTGLPIVKEQESFSYLIDCPEDPNQMELYKRFEQETNVKIDWMAYPFEVAAEKKNLMYSSGDYPDVVGGWLLNDSDITRYGMREGVFMPIEELVAKYAPRMAYVFDNFPEARSALTTPDGHIYTVPLMAPQAQTRAVYFINKTWLAKANLTMPKTTDDLYAALKAFKDADMNGNGKNDEIPISMRANNQLGDSFGWFGLPDVGIHVQMVGQTPTFTANTEGYKEAIKFYAKLFAEGLLDSEAFTQDQSQYTAKGKGPDELYGVYADWYGSGAVGLERFREDYEVMPVLSSPNCADPKWPQGDNWIFRTQTAISATAKNPATILRWFDYVYDEDNSIQIKLGPYGQLIDRKDTGEFVEIPPPEGETIDTMRARLSINAMPYCIMPDVFQLLPRSEENKIKDNTDALYSPDIVDPKLPQYWLTGEESESVATIQTDLNKYIADKRAAWITGQADVDAEWDAYLKQLDTLGLAQYMEVYTAAITRSL